MLKRNNRDRIPVIGDAMRKVKRKVMPWVRVCVGLGNQSRVLPSLLFRLKLSFCLMKYALKGVVSKKKGEKRTNF
jgi:hypothetical protein